MSDPPAPARPSRRRRSAPRQAAATAVTPTPQLATAGPDEATPRLATQPGDAGPAPSVAAELLAEAATLPPDARALIIGAGDGTLPAVIAPRASAGTVTVVEPDLLGLRLTAATLAANDITNVELIADPSLSPAPPGTIDVVLLTVPPERRLNRRWLLAARAALRPGGRLYLCGANDHGVRGATTDAAALFREGVTPLALRRRHRVARGVATPPPATLPDWTRDAGIVPGTWDEFTVTVRDLSITLRSLPGVFAQGRLDAGTALLLDVLDVRAGARVLDAGCGTGIIGLVATRLGAGPVDLVDANLLAVAAARENVARAGRADLRVLPSDILDAVAAERYDLIVSNPPFHAGKAVDDRFATEFAPQAAAALAPGGRVVVVTNRFIRYDAALARAVGPVSVLAETGQYRVLQASAR